MSSKKSVKCKICNKKYVSKEALISHIDREHQSNIPEGWNAARYENYLRTGKTEGRCVECKKPTTWNDATGKYNRMCGSEACKKAARERANKNYIGLHGKPYSINNPEQQKKMVYGRKNSGTYIFKDEDTGKEYKAMYDSSYGKDFLEMIDAFLNWDGADIIAPSPHTYYYEYEGKKHFYIPDVYSTSLNLEIELKDGGDNPNKHPKIQAVDKVKEQKKDEVMESLKGQVNYIKICNKEYDEFFALLSELRSKDVCNLPKWESQLERTLESVVIEGGIEDSDDYLAKQILYGKRVHDLNNPVINYDSLVKYYRKRLFYDDLTKQEWNELYRELLQIRNYLKGVSNKNSDNYDDRMEYEANRALVEINKFIMYMEDSRDHKKIRVTESSNNNLVPIYLVSWDYSSLVGMGVKFAIQSRFNHSSIALTPDLEYAYTFSREPQTPSNIHKNGFCREPISYMIKSHKGCNIKVDEVYITRKQYDKLKEIIDKYIENGNNTGFDYINFARIALGIENKNIDPNRLNCSCFVDLVLKGADIDLTKKPSNLVTPADLASTEEDHPNIKTVYIGKAIDYNPRNIQAMESTFIEGIKNGIKRKPVFVFLSYTDTAIGKVITKVKREPYSHASLSFDNKLTNMVSFDARGMVNESIFEDGYVKHPDKAKYSLYMYMANDDEYNAIRAFVDSLLEKRDKLFYNLIGLSNFIFGKGSEREDRFFCSEFVAAAIAAGNKQILKYETYMTSPYMLRKTKDFIFVKQGKIKNYDPIKIDQIIKEKLKKGGFTDVNIE